VKFLLDENIPGHTESFLTSEGHEVLRVAQGTEDERVMSLGEERRAVVVTRDRDFLNFLPSSLSGIIYVPIHPSIAEHITEAMKDLLQKLPTPDRVLGRVTILKREGYETLPPP